MIILVLLVNTLAEITGDDLLEEMLSDYDSTVAADNSEVSLTFELSHIFNFEEGGNYYNIILGYSLTWQDSRLAFADQSSLKFLEFRNIPQVWRPRVLITNLQLIEEITLEKLLIYANGTLSYIKRLSGSLSCNYNFALMPYDSQECHIMFINQDDTSFVFKDVYMDVSSSIYLPEWKITNYDLCSHTYRTMGRNYSAVMGNIHIERRKAGSFAFVVLPGFLITALSYSSFWIDYRASPSRTTLAVITVLTSLTQIYNVFREFANIGYNTWLLQFLFINCCFTISAMLEYALVNKLHVREEKKIAKKKADMKLHTIRIIQVPPQSPEEREAESSVHQSSMLRFKIWVLSIARSPPHLVDYFFRFGFALVYTVLIINLYKDISMF